MRYDLSAIEEQIIETIKSNENFNNVSVRTHTGDINPQTFFDEKLKEGFIRTLPFIYVQYNGRKKVSEDSTKKTVYFQLRFRIYIGAKSLREKREAQLTAYQMLSYVYDALHGKTPKATDNEGWAIPFLDGDTITTPFTCSMPIISQDGENEKLLVNIPNIVVYQSDYVLTVMA